MFANRITSSIFLRNLNGYAFDPRGFVTADTKILMIISIYSTFLFFFFITSKQILGENFEFKFYVLNITLLRAHFEVSSEKAQ